MAESRSKYYLASLVIHIVMIVLLSVSLSSKPDSARALQIKNQPKPVDIVKATAVDETAILAEMERRKKLENQQKKNEEIRKKRLEREAKRASDKRKAEEKRLQKLKKKAEAEKKKRLAEEKKLKEQAALEAERVAKLKKEQEALEKEKAAIEQKKAEEKRQLAELEMQRKMEQERLAEDQAKKEAAAERLKEEAEQKRLREEQLARERALKEQMAKETTRLEQEQARQMLLMKSQYESDIASKVQRNWQKPTGTQADNRCNVLVKQIPGGEVIDVKVTECTGSVAFKRSVENAVLKASPLPTPLEPSLFEREIVFIFKPEE